MIESVEAQAFSTDSLRWIEEVVVGLDLCPFARKVLQQGRVRSHVSLATHPVALLADLAAELTLLSSTPREEVETSLLIHPHVLQSFLDFNDFLGEAETLVRRLGLRGEVQVVGFHPEFRFEGAPADAAGNYTNRSPYPMLHLLREVSVSEVAARPRELLAIPERNERVLSQLGKDELSSWLRACRTKL